MFVFVLVKISNLLQIECAKNILGRSSDYFVCMYTGERIIPGNYSSFLSNEMV